MYCLILSGLRELPSDREVKWGTAIVGAENECRRQSTVSEREGGEENVIALKGEVRV